MHDFEASSLPTLDGDFWVVDGHRFPRMRGAEVDQAGAEATDAAVDQGDSTETQGEDQGYDAPFNLAEVPEEYRGDVERYVKQTQADYTRKTQTLAEQRREVEDMLELSQRLGDEGQREEALRDLLNRFDLELELEGDEEDGDVEDDPGQLVDESELPTWAKELLEREQQREQSEQERRQTRAQQEAEGKLREHVGKTMEAFKAKAYPDAEALPDPVNDALLGFGMVLPPRSDGLPDMDAAVTMLEGIEAAAVQRFVDQQRGKTPPLPATRRGTSGTRRTDLSDDRARLTAANAVAARHLESGAT